jgi:NAD(P)-dependent dehydrogenase (short-subunit alcohol dehydrogenase family)
MNMQPDALRNYSPQSHLLQDRVILVTGASEGIGKAVALAYAEHGATVILLAKDLKKLEQVYDQIENADLPQPAIYPMNLEGATVKDYEDLTQSLYNEFGRLDGLLNNAGWVGGLTPLKHYDVQRWARVMTINLHAPFILTKACLPLLEKAADPVILFSTHACLKSYWGAYGVAKHGLLGLLKILSEELDGDKPIRVNGIDTGPVRSWMRLQNYPGEDPYTLPAPQAVVSAYLYFMGPDSRGVSGENVLLGGDEGSGVL